MSIGVDNKGIYVLYFSAMVGNEYGVMSNESALPSLLIPRYSFLVDSLPH